MVTPTPCAWSPASQGEPNTNPELRAPLLGDLRPMLFLMTLETLLALHFRKMAPHLRTVCHLISTTYYKHQAVGWASAALLRDCLGRRRQTSVKGQRGGLLGFVGHLASSQLWCENSHKNMNEWAVFQSNCFGKH